MDELRECFKGSEITTGGPDFECVVVCKSELSCWRSALDCSLITSGDRTRSTMYAPNIISADILTQRDSHSINRVMSLALFAINKPSTILQCLTNDASLQLRKIRAGLPVAPIIHPSPNDMCNVSYITFSPQFPA